MPNVEAKLKIKGKTFEILVDVDKAIQLKKGLPVSMDNVLATPEIFSNVKKGDKISSADLTSMFGTDSINDIAKKIILQGELQVPSEYRKKEVDERKKQVINFLTKNSIDPTSGTAISESRISDAIDQSGIKIENKPIESQISAILNKLKEIMPIKIETKKIRLTIPSIHTGKAYGLINEYKEKENWLSNGDLQVIINIPAGLQMEFYDKLNSVTHGSALSEEVKDK